jgi:hypothetical protein
MRIAMSPSCLIERHRVVSCLHERRMIAGALTGPLPALPGCGIMQAVRELQADDASAD